MWMSEVVHKWASTYFHLCNLILNPTSSVHLSLIFLFCLLPYSPPFLTLKLLVCFHERRPQYDEGGMTSTWSVHFCLPSASEPSSAGIPYYVILLKSIILDLCLRFCASILLLPSIIFQAPPSLFQMFALLPPCYSQSLGRIMFARSSHPIIQSLLLGR